MTTLRWGLLGTAHINRRLIPAMRAVRRSSLAAVASRDRARATAYARDWDIAVAYGSYDALLRDRSVDAVYIPLPNSLHVEWTLRALDAGKHVLCEKPLALAAEDVDRIEAVARARALVAAEAFMYRHEPLIARVVELIENDALGPLRTIAAGFTYEQARSPDVRLDAALGGGSLWDVGCYAVSAARLIARSEPVEVSGFASMTSHGVDESFTGLLRFPGDLVATVHSSFRAHYRSWLEIGGAGGALRIANPFRPGEREEIEWQRGDETRRLSIEGSPALFVRQVDDFVAAALDGKPPLVSLQESRGNTAALAALYESARRGRVVKI
jgi:predicted dehydrogenase